VKLAAPLVQRWEITSRVMAGIDAGEYSFVMCPSNW